MESPHQIDIHHEFNLVELLHLQLLRPKHPLITHEDVDRGRLLDHTLNGVVVPDVNAEDFDVAAGGLLDRLLGILELGVIASEEGDVGALSGAEVAQGEADSAGTPRDEHVALSDWDLDGLRPDDEVEDHEETDCHEKWGGQREIHFHH